jgi:hypothetical protein
MVMQSRRLLWCARKGIETRVRGKDNAIVVDHTLNNVSQECGVIEPPSKGEGISAQCVK